MDGVYTLRKAHANAQFIRTVPISVGLRRMFSSHYMELIRRSSTRRHAAFVETPSKQYMVQTQKSWMTLITPLEAPILTREMRPCFGCLRPSISERAGVLVQSRMIPPGEGIFASILYV